MLKLYSIQYYYKLDDGDWKFASGGGSELLNNQPEEEIIFHDLSWQELREYLMTTYTPDMHNDFTGFKRIPYIAMYDWATDTYDRYFEGDFEQVAYKKVYEEWTDASLDFIIRHFPADQTIQYMRERGLGVMSNEA